MRFQRSTFSFEAPENWCDITPEDDPAHPFTMALEDGVGVIQISLTEWIGGRRPDISADRIEAMFADYCKAQRLDIDASTFGNSRVFGIGGASSTEHEFIGAWYLTNGASVALVTYISEQPRKPGTKIEFEVAKRLVESADFQLPDVSSI